MRNITDELKPCPICGTVTKDIEVCCFGKMFYVYCGNCEAETDIYATQEEAIEDWNKGTARGGQCSV